MKLISLVHSQGIAIAPSSTNQGESANSCSENHLCRPSRSSVNEDLTTPETPTSCIESSDFSHGLGQYVERSQSLTINSLRLNPDSEALPLASPFDSDSDPNPDDDGESYVGASFLDSRDGLTNL